MREAKTGLCTGLSLTLKSDRADEGRAPISERADPGRIGTGVLNAIESLLLTLVETAGVAPPVPRTPIFLFSWRAHEFHFLEVINELTH